MGARGSDDDLTVTRQQARVIALIGSGLTHQQIAASMHVSVDTVSYHLRALRDSWGPWNCAALVSIGYARGVLSTESWPPDIQA